VPALFGCKLLGELAALDGVDGAKRVIARYEREAHFMPFPQGEVDVDTPEDFSRLVAQDPAVSKQVAQTEAFR
jgi:molybdenum cofactor cytidylyltransferase